MFEGEKTFVFWIGLIILALASVGLFTVAWFYAIYPSEHYLKTFVPAIVGGIVFVLIGLYMMKSSVREKPYG